MIDEADPEAIRRAYDACQPLRKRRTRRVSNFYREGIPRPTTPEANRPSEKGSGTALAVKVALFGANPRSVRYTAVYRLHAIAVWFQPVAARCTGAGRYVGRQRADLDDEARHTNIPDSGDRRAIFGPCV